MMAGTCAIPKAKGYRNETAIPGWNLNFEDLRQTALFWHWLLNDNQCPRTGTVANVRRKTRSRYHLAIRNTKRDKASIVANKL